MIFLDTNVLLRFLITPTNQRAEWMSEAARLLIADIESGQVEATISEVVFHEVCFVLAAKTHYSLTWSDIADHLRPILEIKSLKLSHEERSVYLRALEIAVLDTKLESADALILARCEAEGHTVATFDRRMKRHKEVSFHS